MAENRDIDNTNPLQNDKNIQSRRRFLKTAGIAGAAGFGALINPVLSRGTVTIEESAQTGKALEKMPTRRFGKTGVDVSILGLGCMFDVVSNQLMLRQALKWGVNYWDTADCYSGGNSEKGMGKFFTKYPETRKDVFLVTKSCARSPEGMTRLLNQSFDRMKTDYIDLYFAHGIKDISEVNDDTRRWAEDAKKAGKIKFFGFSTHSNMEKCMMAASKMEWIDGIMMTYNYRIMDTPAMKEAIAACTEANIGLTAMKTQGMGPAAGSESETQLQMVDRFMKLGYTDMQARLKLVWEVPEIASIASQMPNMTILAANTAAALNTTKISLKEQELSRMYAMETASCYCRGCTDICESAIDNQIPVGDVMRCLMYSRQYQDQELAKSVFFQIPEQARQAMADMDYSRAQKECPHKMPIASLMKAASEELV
ncbi:MAG: aldo/keto reductase [Desulfamplus sp.]|nr:aldo/keto reductase [Desulfamplus sp.]